MSATEIRERYIKFFERNGHTHQSSSDIVPKNDSTLLFTNAGMVPFKQYFLNPSTAPFKTVTTVQKCVRAGGKHNDLDQVGYTPRHHTFFEMLGNFSFGAYGKREIIHMAWRFIIEELKMPKENLRVTVHESDDEAYAVWKDEVGVDPKRIVRLGDEDNFWSMGAGEGPCGVSSEIFWDTKNHKYSEDDEERWLEFWNLVFMQNYRDASGGLRKLDVPCIDTGMGLERVASILQGKKNNFDTDEFQTIIRSIAALQTGPVDPVTTGNDGNQQLTYKRIIADHLRASAFLISEGVYPGNTGRSYVLRRIIRRAVRAGRLLGINGPILPSLYPSLEEAMGTAYPELIERRQAILSVLQAEEDAFLSTLGKGMALLENIFAAHASDKTKQVSASDAFALYDTHGFPVDLTEIIARDQGWTVDVEGFEKIQRESRERNKASWKKSSVKNDAAVASELDAVRSTWQEDARIVSAFSGYNFDPESDVMTQDSSVIAFQELSNGDAVVVIDPCPFYAAGGGQEADKGLLVATDSQGARHEYAVTDAQKLQNGSATVLYVPAVGEKSDMFSRGVPVTASVDPARRLGNAVHHTATHLLNSALRQVLGPSVLQAGSLVEPRSLRFDFTSKPLTKEQLDEIETIVNRAALSNAPVDVSEMSLDTAKSKGALAMFSEKYDQNSVRVVEVPGHSMELCGGTHLHSVRGVFPFQIISEGSIGAGTRRIEAVAGLAGSQWLQTQVGYAKHAAELLGCSTNMNTMATKVQQGLAKQKTAQMDAEYWLKVAAVHMQATSLTVDVGGQPLIVHALPNNAGESQMEGRGDPRVVKARAEHLRDAEPLSVHLVVQGKMAVLCVGAQCEGVNAGKLLKEVFKKIPGRGGGQGGIAQGQFASPVDVDVICGI